VDRRFTNAWKQTPKCEFQLEEGIIYKNGFGDYWLNDEVFGSYESAQAAKEKSEAKKNPSQKEIMLKIWEEARAMNGNKREGSKKYLKAASQKIWGMLKAGQAI
jgi:hypothetical protein